MISTRLTKWIRYQIRDIAVADAMTKKVEELKREENIISLEVYRSFFPESVTKPLDQVDQKWINKSSTFSINMSNGYQVSMELDTPMPIPAKVSRYDVIGFVTDVSLNSKITRLLNSKENLNEERRNIKKMLDTLLSGITTYKQLETLWPDGKIYYGKYIEASASSSKNVPAIMIENVNKALGLPKAA